MGGAPAGAGGGARHYRRRQGYGRHYERERESVATNPTFHIPRRFHPGYALLGRGLRRWLKDPLQAEAWLVVALSGGATLLLLGQYLGWALLQPTIAAAPTGPVALAFWGGQVASVVVFVLVGLVGFQPAIMVHCMASVLVLRQGGRKVIVPYADVRRAEVIPARLYHRHYRRYATTVAFVNAVPEAVLLLHTPDRPIALGLSATDREAVMACIRAAVPHAPPSSPQHVP